MNNLKKIIIILLFLCSIFTISPLLAAEPFNVSVNGKEIDFDVEPILDHGTTFVPVRFIVEELGAAVQWKDDKVAIAKDNTTITCSIDSKTVHKNGRILVPVRFISESFGAQVNYYGKNKINITVRCANKVKQTQIQNYKRGNTIGNISNDGRFCKNGEWIYFSNNKDKGKLYKKKLDGTGEEKISDDEWSSFINSIDDEIYYSSSGKLTKCKTDGSQKTILDTGANCVNVIDDWIYYTKGPIQIGRIYRMKTDGSCKEKMCDNSVTGLVVYKDEIYYTIEFCKLFKMKTDGSNKVKLFGAAGEYISQIDIKDQWLYFGYKDALYKIKTDGSSLTKIVDDYAQDINIIGDWIYYSNHSEYSKKLYRVKIDGTSRQKLSDDKVSDIHNIGNYIYYCNLYTNEVKKMLLNQ
jgi:hypothetical protein